MTIARPSRGAFFMHLSRCVCLSSVASLLLALCTGGIAGHSAELAAASPEAPRPIAAALLEREPRLPSRGPDRQPPVPAAVTQEPANHPLQPAEPPTQVPVLLYHDLVPGARGGNGTTVDLAEFASQMAWLAENGYNPVSSADLLAWLQGKGQLPPRPVQIHFDDGYRSNYELALPLMQKHGMRGVLFLVSAFADDPGMLSWAEVREMQDAFEIQGHTHAGHDRTDGKPNLIAWSDRQIREDFRGMVRQFTAAGLPAPAAFSYPYGAYDAEVIAALRSEGVALAFTVEHGYVRRTDDPFRLKRLIVWPGLSECQFAALVTGRKGCD